MRFEDRAHAGRVLAGMLRGLSGRDCTVLAVPNGGVPVGIRIAEALGAELGVEIVRKLQIPGNPEAGFGAVTSLGDIILNRFLVKTLGLSQDQIGRAAAGALAELRKRREQFGPFRPRIEHRTVILTDDGLASGFTMIAAARSVRRLGPSSLIVAVPTAPPESAGRVGKIADRVVCPDIRRGLSFAVAGAYENWYDLSTDEAVEMLREWRTARSQRIRPQTREYLPGHTNNP